MNKDVFLCTLQQMCVNISHLLSVRALWLKWRMSWWRGSGWTSATSSSSSSTTIMGVFCRKSHRSYKYSKCYKRPPVYSLFLPWPKGIYSVFTFFIYKHTLIDKPMLTDLITSIGRNSECKNWLEFHEMEFELNLVRPTGCCIWIGKNKAFSILKAFFMDFSSIIWDTLGYLSKKILPFKGKKTIIQLWIM